MNKFKKLIFNSKIFKDFRNELIAQTMSEMVTNKAKETIELYTKENSLLLEETGIDPKIHFIVNVVQNLGLKTCLEQLLGSKNISEAAELLNAGNVEGMAYLLKNKIDRETYEVIDKHIKI